MNSAYIYNNYSPKWR
ncbi:hypothetical protein ABFA07_019060 [Porites harrisoni]